jgi:hypothetical protein
MPVTLNDFKNGILQAFGKTEPLVDNARRGKMLEYPLALCRATDRANTDLANSMKRNFRVALHNVFPLFLVWLPLSTREFFCNVSHPPNVK